MTLALPDLSPALEAQLQPPCEWYVAVLLAPERYAVEPDDCPNAAAWALRTRCLTCNEVVDQLVCEAHRDVVAAGTGTFCPRCRRIGVMMESSERRLRP